MNLCLTTLDPYVIAEQAVQIRPANLLDLADSDHKTLLRLAKDAAWLLDQRDLTAGPQAICKRYLKLLFNYNLATYLGTVKAGKLLEAFENFYSPKLLERLHCGIERKINWLRRLVQSSSTAQHPLHHLLLIHFLDCSTEKFFQLSKERSAPFGKGPWLCLNRASNHFKQARITKCEIGYRIVDNMRPEGTFSCDSCGFTYCRIGPDRTAASRSQISRVKSYGPVWEDALKKLCEVKCSHKEMARQLGVSIFIIRNHIAMLKRTNSQEGANRKAICSKQTPSRTRKTTPISLDLLESNRKKWKSAIEENPDEGRSAIRSKISAVFNWLYKHDREWLNNHSPERRNSSGPPCLIDWEARDDELVKIVKGSAKRIMQSSGRPIRVTKTAIARDVGILAILSKRGHLIPSTAKCLVEIAESVEAYAIRRIWWAAECFKHDGIIPSHWDIQLKAAVSDKIAKRAKVKEAISASIQSLEKQETRGLRKAG